MVTFCPILLDLIIYVVDTEGIEPLMGLGDVDATDLGFFMFNPEGREPTELERTVKRVDIKDGASLGEGTIPDAKKRARDIRGRESKMSEDYQ